MNLDPLATRTVEYHIIEALHLSETKIVYTDISYASSLSDSEPMRQLAALRHEYPTRRFLLRKVYTVVGFLDPAL